MSTENKMGQKQAVIAAVTQILGSLAEGANARELLSEEQLLQVKDIVANGIINGTVAFSKANADEKAIRRYVTGLVDNHLRKAKELNGGQKYVAANARGPRKNKEEAKRSSVDTSSLPPELANALM